MASPPLAVAEPGEDPPPSQLAEPHEAPRSARKKQEGVTEDLFEEILVRTTDPEDLARACVVCPTFRRIITGPTFVRRYRRLHPPLFLGILGFGCFQVAQPPYPTARAARALAGAADFTLSFIPPCSDAVGTWLPVDTAGGRILMSDLPMVNSRGAGYPFSDLLVCDPLSRSYVLIPPIPDELAGPFRRAVEESFLAPSEDDEDETKFRVICTLRSSTNLDAFIFSSKTGQWCATSFRGWGDLVGVIRSSKSILTLRDYACGCFYWKLDEKNKLVVLDTSSMEFSTIDLPPSDNMQHIGVVDAGGGRIGFFAVTDEDENCNHDFHYTIRWHEDQWLLERTIPLPASYLGFETVAAARCLFLWGIPNGGGHAGSEVGRPTEFVCLDVETFEFQRIGMSYGCWFFHPHPYFGYPPSLSTPSL